MIASTPKPCIDIWAPGGTLGLPIFAASGDADDAFSNILSVSESATYLTAGVAAQYLSLVSLNRLLQQCLTCHY